ncbi:MAG: DUF481 domain-containing protein [Fidelibacterota bacterium]|nr:MAG: DUF481 domain-containing protein [Candidatus Neomarinimicrobiota bacterium]
MSPLRTFALKIALTTRLTLTALVLASLLFAQVNTEALRREELAPGLHTTLGADLGLIAGNSDLLRLKSNLRFDYLGGGNHFFLVTQYQQGSKDEQVFINKGFAHLRSVRALRRRLHAEGFLQREFNEFISLEDRQLAGGGLRIRWQQRGGSAETPPPLQLNTGIGLMWERERIDTTGNAPGDPVHGAVASLVRSTNYLVLRWRLDERLTLFSTTYYQVDLRRFSDYRLLWEGRLGVTLTKRLSLTLNLDLRYDSEPPGGIKPCDLEITNGVSYRL